MLKLIIADDEPFILNSLCSSIEWIHFGIQLCAACADGIEAYHAILDENPDIVMTDIRMPGLSGLELIEKTQAINPETVFIILSGYQEFEYARTAMQYGVRHYLLKPCTCEKISEVLTTIVSSLQKSRASDSDMPPSKISHSFALDEEQIKQDGCDAPYRSFVREILNYSREHMSDTNLSLKMIAEQHLYMNTDYVSREFYKETGEKFSAYLNRIRMERAKELLNLANEEDKIYSIAEQVGCSNARYFSQVFRKYTGSTPSKYIQLHKKR
jgi:YesN/AraC family two-component response regulator